MKIIIAKEGFSATYARDLFDEHVASPYVVSLGYDRGENGVIAKNYKGENDIRAFTKTYADIETSPDGTEYWKSPSNDPRFCDWKEYWEKAGLPDCYEEIEMPQAWASQEKES